MEDKGGERGGEAKPQQYIQFNAKNAGLSVVSVVCNAGLIPVTNNRANHAAYTSTQTGKFYN